MGYIRLSGFSDHSAEALDKAAAEDVKAGQTKLILDLRGNPGGFVTAARDVASQFLARRHDLLGGGRAGEPDRGRRHARRRGDGPGDPARGARGRRVRVGVGDRGGALHDRGRATLVGTKTFGKGTVQQWTQLEDDSGGFRLTIAKWLTPNKTSVHGVGITPDVVVDAVPARAGR